MKYRFLIHAAALFLFLACLPLSLKSQQNSLRINEIMCMNGTTIADEDGDYIDWIEIYNAGTETASIGDWTLTDEVDIPGKWVFPDVTIPPDGYLLVFASGKDRNIAGKELHTNFKLSSLGEYLGFFDPAGNPATVFDPSYPPQQADFSYGMLSGLYVEFSSPSPREPNIEEAGILASPVFGTKHGLFENPFDLNITKADDNVRVFYTSDGSLPDTVSGILYTAPLRIESTSVIRAFSVSSDGIASRVITQSYIFPADVIHQPNNPEGYPFNWGPYTNSSELAIGDYEMDPELTDDPLMAERVINALKSLPIVSLVSDVDNFFSHSTDPDSGGIYIYTGASSTGRGWERPASFEFIEAGDSNSIQVNCGMQLMGGASRNPEKSPKHSFRIVFRGEYGASKLNYPIFHEEDANDSFDNLVLRAGFNLTWHHWNGGDRAKSQYINDIWNKDTQRGMGHHSSRSVFAHLYINGIYWGMYAPSERMDSDFGAAYMGGDDEDYDVIKDYADVADGNIIAWNKMMAMANGGLESDAAYQRLQGNNPDGSYNPDYEDMVDVVNLADYMLLNFYAGNTDWDHHNWAAMRNRKNPEGFKFLTWDPEHTLKSLGENVTGENNSNCPSRIYQQLTKNDNFKRLFADRVQKYCFNGGLLSPGPIAERWTKRMEVVEPALDAESARWGDYRRDVHVYRSAPYDLYTKETHWMTESQFLFNTYFPQRTDILIEQLRQKDMFPDVNAPEFFINNVPVGETTIDRGDQLRMLADQGDIYYTTDGSDPAKWETTDAVEIVKINADKRVLVPKSDIGTTWITDYNYDDSAWKLCSGGAGGIGYEMNSGYQNLITLDLVSDMRQEAPDPNTSCFVRIPFQLGAEYLVGGKNLILRIWYDDGFIAFLNGTKITSVNAPTAPKWNSASTDGHESSAPYTINLSEFSNILKEGNNLLAIWALNEKTSSSDFLIMADVVSGGAGVANISENAIKYSSDFSLNESTHIRSRATYNGEWSAQMEKFFIVPDDYKDLKITEINYHPLGQDTTLNDGLFEFVEIKNTGTSTLDMGGLCFIDGIEYTFPPETRLGPGEFVVLASDMYYFYQRYGFAAFDDYKGQLNNGGELLVLAGPAGDTLCAIRYGADSNWPDRADGYGKTLVSTEFNPTNDQNSYLYWRDSYWMGGSPGNDDRIDLSAEEITEKASPGPVLSQNFPNPFSDQTFIRFTLPEDAYVQLSVLNMLGQEIQVIHRGNQPAGDHTYVWTGVDRSANEVPEGFYFYRMIVKSRSNQTVITRKMLLMR